MTDHVPPVSDVERHLEDAFEELGDLPDAPRSTTFLPDFQARWGPLDLDALVRAVQGATGVERLIALMALGESRTDQARALLPAFLESPLPYERWISALALGRMGDEHAIPGLCRMLTEFLPQRLEEFLPICYSLFTVWQSLVPRLLRQWDQPVIISALRQTLPRLISVLGQDNLNHDDDDLLHRAGYAANTLHWPDETQRLDELLERYGSRITYTWQPDQANATPLPDPVELLTKAGATPATYRIQMEWYSGELRNLITCQDDIIFTLGRKGALGVLTGLRAAEPYLKVWRVHLLMGYLHDKYTIKDVFPKFSSAFEADLKHALHHWFGLDEEEQVSAIRLHSGKIGKILTEYDSQRYQNA